MKEPNADGRGLLLAMMEPSPALEEEFQDWYDTEHFPERIGTEGFLTGHRFVCLDGWPRYLALYDLTSVNALNGGGYAKIARDNYSVWTGRIVPRVWGHYRAEGVQIYPGEALFGASGLASRIAVWRFRDVPGSLAETVTAGLKTLYAGKPETAQLRVFRYKHEKGADYIGIVELHAPFTPAPGAAEALGESRKHLDMVNTYVRYNRT